MTDRTFLSILRWVAVIPAALLAELISYLIVPFTIKYAASYLDFDSNGIIGTLVLHASMAATFALTGSYTAPKYRKISFITLSLLHIAVYIYDKQGTFELIGCLVGLISSYSSLSKEAED